MPVRHLNGSGWTTTRRIDREIRFSLDAFGRLSGRHDAHGLDAAVSIQLDRSDLEARKEVFRWRRGMGQRQGRGSRARSDRPNLKARRELNCDDFHPQTEHNRAAVPVASGVGCRWRADGAGKLTRCRRVDGGSAGSGGGATGGAGTGCFSTISLAAPAPFFFAGFFPFPCRAKASASMGPSPASE